MDTLSFPYKEGGVGIKVLNMYVLPLNKNNGGYSDLNHLYGVNFINPNIVKEPTQFQRSLTLVNPWSRNT